MSSSMSFPVDVTNPGHFFACCGLLYAADHFFNKAEGCFVGNKFTLQTDCEKNPLLEIINKILPQEQQDLDDLLICDDDEANDTAIFLVNLKIRLDFWNHFDNRPKIKLFAGNQKSKVILLRWLKNIQEKKDDPLLNCKPFDVYVHDLPSGFDTSTSWNALNMGFSLNEQKLNQKIKTYPIIEFFAHIGVQSYAWSKYKSSFYIYHTWPQLFPISIVTAIASGSLKIPGSRCFKFDLKKSGENKILNTAKEMIQ